MNDPLGHILFDQRRQQALSLLQDLIHTPPVTPEKQADTQFVTTGLGSSEAHARFFTHCINKYTSSHAEFSPLCDIAKQNQKSPKTLVLFSQGISPNARIAVQKSQLFAKKILFTSVQSNSITENWIQENGSIINFPIENEYELLIRVIGPLCCYLVIRQYIKTAFLDNTLPQLSYETLSACIQSFEDSAIPNFTWDASQWAHSTTILASTDNLSQYGTNLCYKLTEGLFLSPPLLCDLFSLSHGPFQQLFTNPSYIFLFSGQSHWEQDLTSKAEKLLQSTGSHTWKYTSKLPEPWSILEYESVLNNILLKYMKTLNIDQRKWPGQDLDGPLYQIKSL